MGVPSHYVHGADQVIVHFLFSATTVTPAHINGMEMPIFKALKTTANRHPIGWMGLWFLTAVTKLYCIFSQ